MESAAHRSQLDLQDKFKCDLKRLVRQFKTGCQKPICFNPLCRKNPLSFVMLDPTAAQQIKNDKELLQYCVGKLSSGGDTSALTCAETSATPDAPPFDLPAGVELDGGATAQFVLTSLEWFCCSFVLKSATTSAQKMDVDVQS